MKDHRQIGQELELFYIDDEIGPGLAMWLPKGAIIRRELERYMTDLEIASGYDHVITPHLAKLNLYKKSGHWEHYQKDMFPPMKRGEEEYELRPMNCPHHIQIFSYRPRSYKELPMRIAEFGTLYRWENSGELSGLIRVRSMTLNDAHIFVPKEQLKDEFLKVLNLIEKVYKDLKIEKFSYRLSLHDPKDKEKFGEDNQMWEISENAIRDALKEAGLEYEESVGEAAFYGPKLDVQIPNALGKEETVSTVQVDFNLPQKFDLKYIGEDGQTHPIVMIHRGITSTLERMVGYLTEIYQGAFPVWLSPVQIIVLPITDKVTTYAQTIVDELKAKNIRVQIDDRSETLQAKIRDATIQKIPYLVIVGEKEEQAKTLAIRSREGEDLGQKTLEEFSEQVMSDIAKRS